MSKHSKRTWTMPPMPPAPETVTVSPPPMPPTIQVNIPPVEHHEPPIEARADDRHFWPADKPMPDYYHKQRVPCPACRRIYMDDEGQAAICVNSGAEVAYFRCRVCGHRWPMAVKNE